MEKEIDIVAPDFDRNKTTNYFLGCSIDGNMLSVCVIDTVWVRCLCLKTIAIANNLAETVAAEQLFTYDYAEVAVMYYNQLSVLVPEGYFDAANQSAHLAFAHIIGSEHIVHHNHLKRAEAYNVFALPRYVVGVFSARFPQASYFHQASSLIEGALHLATTAQGGGCELKLNISAAFVDVVISRGIKLLAYNSFAYSTADDIAYYCAALLSEHESDIQQATVCCSSTTHINKDVLDTLNFCFANSSTDVLPAHVNYAEGMADVLSYRFSNLINLYKCE